MMQTNRFSTVGRGFTPSDFQQDTILYKLVVMYDLLGSHDFRTVKGARHHTFIRLPTNSLRPPCSHSRIARSIVDGTR